VLEIEPDNCSSEVGTFVPLFALPRYSTVYDLHLAVASSAAHHSA
jgi:hypothetical protein